MINNTNYIICKWLELTVTTEIEQNLDQQKTFSYHFITDIIYNSDNRNLDLILIYIYMVIMKSIWPRCTVWSWVKANRVLPRERNGHSKHPLPTSQEKTIHMDITRWSILKSDWLYSLQPKMETLYMASKNKTGSWLWLRSWTPYCQIQT